MGMGTIKPRKMMLENETIILKNLSEDDAADLFEYAKSDLVGPNAGWKPHKSIDESLEAIKIMIDTNEVWGIYHKEDNKLIGTIGVHYGKYPLVESPVYALGFVLNPNYWGQGLMKSACDLVLRHTFDNNTISEVYANHFSFNQRSGSFMEKYGMNRVGVWYSTTNQTENILYRMTREDFYGF